MITRRKFLQRLGLAAGAVALSPYLDLAPIEPSVEAVCFNEEYSGQSIYRVVYVMNMMCDNPRRLGVISSVN